MNHLLDFSDIDRDVALKIIETTLKVRDGDQYEAKGHSVIKFEEPSTRTKVSFTIAAQKLGLDLILLEDQTSSQKKGESLDHEIQTLISLGVESLVIRTKEDNLDDYRRFENISIISAGFGSTSHPTQSILDIATLMKYEKLNGDVPLIFIGDIKHSRVYSSTKELLNLLGFQVGIFAPDFFIPEDTSGCHIFSTWDDVIDSNSSINLLRVQKERIDNIDDYDLNDYIHSFQLTNQILDKTSCDFLAIHPMPMNIGVEISKEASENNKFKYIEQLSFGVPSRIASYLYGLGEI